MRRRGDRRSPDAASQLPGMGDDVSLDGSTLAAQKATMVRDAVGLRPFYASSSGAATVKWALSRPTLRSNVCRIRSTSSKGPET